MSQYYLNGFTARCQQLHLTEKQARALWKMAESGAPLNAKQVQDKIDNPMMGEFKPPTSVAGKAIAAKNNNRQDADAAGAPIVAPTPLQKASVAAKAALEAPASQPAPAGAQGAKTEAKPEAKPPLPMEATQTKQLADGSIELTTKKKLVPGSPEYEQFMAQQGQGTSAAPEMPAQPGMPPQPGAM